MPTEKVLVALLGLAGVVIAALLAGIGYLLRRRITGARTQERAALLNSLADLRAKMAAGGLSLHQIRELEGFLAEGQQTGSTAALDTIAGEVAPTEPPDTNLPDSYWSTPAMGARAAARLHVLQAEMDEALTELHTLIDEERRGYLGEVQRAWRAHSICEMTYAGSRYEGGTLGPLIGTLRGVEVAEKRLAELRAEVAEAKRHDG